MTRPRKPAYTALDYIDLEKWLAKQVELVEPEDERWRRSEANEALLLAVRNGKVSFARVTTGGFIFIRE